MPGGVSSNGSIQNGVSRSLISQNFLPKGDTNRRFRRTLSNKRFFGASDTTADHRARSSFVQRERWSSMTDDDLVEFGFVRDIDGALFAPPEASMRLLPVRSLF